MVIYYTRSNGVDDSVMNIHLDNFVQSLPEEIRSNLTLTKHERGTTYNPQLVLNADLVIVGLRDDENEVVGKGVHDECMHALETGKYVLVVRKENNDNGQIFLQEIREQDLDILDEENWQKYAEISLFDYATRSRMPTAVDQHDLDGDILLNFMLGNNEETKEYMRLRFPDFVAPLPVAASIADTFDLLSPPAPQSTNESSNLPLDWPEPNAASTPKTPIYGYRHGDTILVTLPKCIGKIFNFTVSVDWLSPQEDTNMHEFLAGIGLSPVTTEEFVNVVLGKADNWSMTHLWEPWNFGKATKVINALERRIKFAGGTFNTVLKAREEIKPEQVQQVQNTPISDADAFFDLVEKQPQQQESRFMSNEDYISPLDNNDDLLLLL